MELIWTTTFNWTRGDGYYENYRSGSRFSDYNFVFGNDDEGELQVLIHHVDFSKKIFFSIFVA